ncbi:glycine cleavage system aminomethyltransferase GcvT [bacterium]|nr:glycine cleavage system aminomethyltransferase GcvT [bacterium]
MCALLQTPLHQCHLDLNAHMTGFGGWDMPVHYGSQLAEHEAVRNAVGMFDVSHMGQIRFLGENYLKFLALLVPGNPWRLADGGSLYTCLCKPDGGVVDDLIITRLTEKEGFTVVNAATREKDVAWMKEQRDALGFKDVEIIDESEQWAMIAVQGPDALELIEKMIGGQRWTETKAFTMFTMTLKGRPHLVSRTGYTGENGIELLCPAELAPEWWKEFLDAGVQPAGLGARDSLRLEMGYCLYGQDLDETISPVEGGIGWSVSLKKDDPFIGREVLERHKKEGAPRKSVGLKIDSRRPLRHGDEVADGEKTVGVVTSGGYSPTLGCGIAMALVETAAASNPTLQIVSRGKAIEAKVQRPPFVEVKSKPIK